MVTVVVESSKIAISKDMCASYLRTYFIIHDNIARASCNIQLHGVKELTVPLKWRVNQSSLGERC